MFTITLNNADFPFHNNIKSAKIWIHYTKYDLNHTTQIWIPTPWIIFITFNLFLESCLTSVYLNASLITNLLTGMEGCPFPTLVGIWYNPLRVSRAPKCYDEVNIPECNYNFGACCLRQIIRLLELHAVVFWGIQLIACPRLWQITKNSIHNKGYKYKQSNLRCCKMFFSRFFGVFWY